MGFWSQSIAESPPAVLAMMQGTEQVRMWWFTFISSQLNKEIKEGRSYGLKERKQNSGSHWQHRMSDVWTFLCVNQGHRGKWALWEDILREAYLKSCSLNQHDAPLSRLHKGYAKCLPLQCWIYFFSAFTQRVCKCLGSFLMLFWWQFWMKRWD